jgi:hypothetical protein
MSAPSTMVNVARRRYHHLERFSCVCVVSTAHHQATSATDGYEPVHWYANRSSPEGEPLLGVFIPGDLIFRSGAVANSHGTGAPGTVHVTAPTVMLAEGARISSANIQSERVGEMVTVQAADTLEISGTGSGLRASSFGPGPVGRG